MGWRQIRKENLRAIQEVYARAVEQESYLRDLNARNWAMWNEFRRRRQSGISTKEAAEELHQQAHENIQPPWEE